MALKLIFTLFTILSSFASSEYGEFRGELFYGAKHASGKRESFTNSFKFMEDEFRDNYSFFYTQVNLMDVANSLVSLNQSYLCSDADFKEYKDYIRYLYRVAALSLIDSNLQSFSNTAKKIGWKDSCDYDLKKLAIQCSPKSSYMQFFKYSSINIGKSRERFIVKYNMIEANIRASFFKDFSEMKYNDQTKIALSELCLNECDQNSKKQYSKMCRMSKDDFLKICSERDSLYGAFRLPELYNGLVFSEAIREVSRKTYNFKGCLQRFSNHYRSNEHYRFAKNLSNSFYFNRNKNNPLGDLFDISSIKSFLDMGTASLFEKIPSEQPKKVLAKNKPVKLKRDIIKKIKKRVVKIQSKNVIKKEKQKSLKKVSRSYFFEQNSNLSILELSRIKLNMDEFKFDYIFAPKSKELMYKKMYSFTKRKVIESMKVNELLGTPKAAIPILFIKYLIDNNWHQGLFNITSVLGDEFFVFNDIDKGIEVKPIKISLVYDEIKKYWQLTLINTSKP